jgi:hypothetical protein
VDARGSLDLHAGTHAAAAAVLIGWGLVLVAVQRWPSWEEGVRVSFQADARFYEIIARAAPSLPDVDVLRAYAERFTTHWLLGTVAEATDLDLHDLYRGVSIVLVAAILVAVQQTLVAITLDTSVVALCLGVVAVSAYPAHYLLAAPGMTSDAMFVLGLSITLLGFVRGHYSVVAAGLVIATLGRQTAIPVGLAAAAWVWIVPAWRTTRVWRALGCMAATVGVYAVLYVVATPFTMSRPAGISNLTVIGFMTGVRPFVEHVGLVVLGIAVPAALVLGAWLRTRAPLPVGPLLLAAAVVAQPLLLGPLANKSNEPRLAGLAVPALAVAAAFLLRGARLRLGETAVAAAAIAVGGLHSRYTHVGIPSSAAWSVLELVAAGVVLVVVARGGADAREQKESEPRAARA